MSDTPETDALLEAINGDAQRHEFDFVEMIEHARKLERERDEALAKHRDGTCLDCGGPLQAVRPGKHQCDACDNLRHIETMLEETAKLAAALKRERDEARRLIAALREDQTRLLLERDRLRQQLAELGESMPQDNPTRRDGRVEKTEHDLQQ
jgi:hypothetical protein